MAHAETAPTAATPGSPRRRWPWIAGIAAAVVLLGLLALWLASGWQTTYRQAQALQAQAGPLTSAVSDRDFALLSELLPQAAADARALADSTGSLQWQLLTLAPIVGKDASAVNDAAFAVAPILESGLPLVDVADRLLEDGLRGSDGAIDVDALDAAAVDLQSLADSLAKADEVLAPIDAGALRPELQSGIASLQEAVAGAAPAARTAADIATYVPQMLGQGGSRSWLMLLQNPAESRGSGGFPGGYVVLTAAEGALSVVQTGTSADLDDTDIPAGIAPDDAQAMWGDRLQSWSTYSDTPNFPTTGLLTQAGLAARGVDVDGVIAFDPATVAALLEATGPVKVGDREFTAANVEKFFLEDVYQEFPDPDERDRVSLEVVGAALARFVAGDFDPLVLAEALASPIARDKVRMWSDNPDEQVWLEGTAIGGLVPETPGPVVAVAFNNSAANKMDAFVTTRVLYRPGTCPTVTTQTSSVEVTVRNDAPADLGNASGNYGRSDVESPPEGSTSLVPYIYTPVNAAFVSSAIDGVESKDVFGNGELGRAAYFAYLPLERGQERTLTVTFTEPTVDGVAPQVLRHGMAHDTEISIEPNSSCG